MKNYPIVPLGQVVFPINRAEPPVAGKMYRQLGVKLWGKGGYERESIDGGHTKYKVLSRVEANDIVVNKIWARNGSVAVVPTNLAGCYCSSEFPTFVPAPDKLEPGWFHWLTKTKGFWSKCDEKSRGTSGKNRIRPERFLEIEIPLPPLDQQRRIVARIGELAAKIAEAKALRNQSAENANSLLDAALADLFATDGRKWPIKKLAKDNLATVIAGQHIIASEYNDARQGIPYLTGPADFGVTVPEIKRWTLKPKVIAQEGDVLLTVKGAGVGKINLAPAENVVIGRQLMAIRPNPHKLSREFLFFVLRYRFRYFQSIATATTVPGFRKTDVESLNIKLPSIREQGQIAMKLSHLQNRAAELKNVQAHTSTELDAMLPAILDQAFKGEL